MHTYIYIYIHTHTYSVWFLVMSYMTCSIVADVLYGMGKARCRARRSGYYPGCASLFVLFESSVSYAYACVHI